MGERRGIRGRYAVWVRRLRWPIVVFWVAAAVVTTRFLPSIDEAQVGALGDLVPHNAAAIKAEERSHKLFGFPLLSRTVVVQRRAGGLSSAAQERVVRRANALNHHRLPGVRVIAGAAPIINAFGKPPFSRERSTTALTFLFFPSWIGPSGRAQLTKELEQRYISRPSDALVGSTGTISAREEQASVVHGALPIVEIATLLLVLIAVAWHFRSVIAPLVNVATVAISYLVSIRVIAAIGQALGVSVPREVTPVIVVLLFGVITDYSIFFLSRFRALLGADCERRAGAERTAREIGPIVFTAGTSVVLASSALLVAQLGFLQAFGPGMALAVLIGLAVALTLLPALLAIGGRMLFWPRRPGIELAPEAAAEESAAAGARPRRTRVLTVASRYPALVVLGCLALLGAAASGVRHLEVGNPLIRGLPPGNSVRVAYSAASHGFAPGILAPTVAIAEAPGIGSKRAALGRVQRLIEREPGVAAVAGPASSALGLNVGATVAPRGDAVRFVVVLKDDPLGAAAIADFERLRRDMPQLIARAGLGAARTSFAGDTALAAETADKTVGDLGRVAPVTIAVVLLILALFLRALVAPLYLVVASVIAVAAALGLTTYVFVDLIGQGGLTYYTPFTVAVLLVALGSDYNVFVVGRIWQEAAHRPLRAAVVVGGARAARSITVAGLILGTSFALLAIVPLQPFREIAFAMAAGLLLDTLLVRTLLVPALIALFGKAGAWPGRGLVSTKPAPAGAPAGR